MVHLHETLHELGLLALGVCVAEAEVGRLGEVDKESHHIITQGWLVSAVHQNMQ